jgi:multicomponent Na+:H+ antiporter subunit B
MNSLILQISLRWLVPLLALASLFLLIRGHHEPGGGFAGGLVAALAVVLLSLAEGTRAARRFLRFSPTRLIATGLLIAVFSGCLRLLTGDPFLESIWVSIPLGFTYVKLGTPLLFDCGVYLLVLGVGSAFVLDIEDAEEDELADGSRISSPPRPASESEDCP